MDVKQYIDNKQNIIIVNYYPSRYRYIYLEYTIMEYESMLWKVYPQNTII